MDKSLQLLNSKYQTFTVAKVSITTGYVTHLYGHIENLNDAYLLAQYSMNAHRASTIHTDELVVIFPGSNLGLKDASSDKYLQKLIEKYSEKTSESL